MVKNWPSHLGRYIRTHTRGIFVTLAIAASSIGLASVPMQTTYAAPEVYSENTASCQIATVGWVICPVMRSIATLADFGFAFINQNFLRIEYNISNTDSGVYKAWELMRTIANALFVLAFMAIVYAQITGRNAGGYNIKRILPKLIIGAILVNISYLVCAIGIEASNIAGDSILAMMQGVANSIGPAAMTLTSAENGFSDTRLTELTSSVLGKQGVVWILLAPVAAVTVSIALICAAGLVLLIMRKVVVAMLVLVSPLMFVTYLLPNTEKFFQQWLRLFFQLLLLYPIIAFLLGTGQIVSATIMNVGSDDSNYEVRDDGYRYSKADATSGSITTDLAAAGAAVLPLLGTWFLLKSVSSVVTNAGTKVAGNIGRSRGKNEEDKIKAKLDGKAKQAVAGSGLPTFDRKPAFSRLRRRRGAAALGDGLPAKGDGSTKGKAGKAATGGQASLLDRAMGNVNSGAAAGTGSGDEESRKLEDAANAKIAEAEAGKLQASLSADGKDEKKTAKDIFNNLNKTHDMDKKNSGGGGGSGGSGDGEGKNSPTTSQPKAPSNNFSGVPTAGATASSQAPSAPQIQQIIAVPTAPVDASTFVNKDAQTTTAGANPSMPQPPSSDVEKKATARAQKYIFDSQDDLEKSSDRLDELKEQAEKMKKAKQDDKDER